MRKRLLSFPVKASALFGLALIVALGLGCDLDNGNEFNDPDRDPVIIVDPSTVAMRLDVFPSNLPADGESHGTLAAHISVNGADLVGVPVLFYSEWGRLFTACSGSRKPVASAFSRGLITNSEGWASTLLESPVLPALYRDDNESNTVAAFFLVDGMVYSAYNTQVLWQVDIWRYSDGTPRFVVQSSADGSEVSITTRYLTGRGDPVTGCASVDWTITPTEFIEGIQTSSCDSDGHARLTFNVLESEAGDTADRLTVQVAAHFQGSGPNECVLDQTATYDVIASVNLRRPPDGGRWTIVGE